MTTSSTTPPGTSPNGPDGAAVPSGTARKRAATRTRSAPKRREQPPVRTAGATGQPEGQRLSDAERQRRIEEAAYRKAESRGFVGDRQLDDWLEAEREHDEHGSVGAEGGSR